MNHITAAVPSMSQLLEGYPSNWGRWGSDDEVGSLNYLDQAQAKAGASCVRQGSSFTLQIPMATASGDPVVAGRASALRFNVIDHGHFIAGRLEEFPGGVQYADDYLSCYLQGTTHADALGHLWFGEQLYNGFSALTTLGGMGSAGILPIAERGIVGRGVLLDIARYRGVDRLAEGETFTHRDLLDCAASQNVELTPRSVLLVRTGWLEQFLTGDLPRPSTLGVEPGLTVSRELAEWFHQMEIPVLATDTFGNEVTIDPKSGAFLPVHCALMRNLGIVMLEIASLSALADDCAADGQYDFLFTAAPLKVTAATGAPVNPIVVK